MKRIEKAESEALDALLAKAADVPGKAPDALVARVLADAERLQPAASKPTRKKVHFGQRVSEIFGGWQGLGGMVAATCAGVWIGLSPPDAMPDAGAFLLGYETADFTTTTAELTSFGWDAEEG